MILKATLPPTPPERVRRNEDSFTWSADGDTEAAVGWKEGRERQDPSVVL